MPNPPPVPAPPRRSMRTRRAPVRYGTSAKSVSTTNDVDVPKTWKQVLCSPDKEKWIRAAEEEFSSLLGMSTWTLVPWPLKRKIICSKWVLKPKRRPDGSIIKLKACLVAMSYAQEKGIDFDKVFAPTTRAETLRLVLSLLGAHHRLTGSRKWGAYQIDFKTTFLNGKLDQPIYMYQAPGFEDPEYPDHIYKLTGSIYGLKQSPRQWSKALYKLLISLNLIQSNFDPTLYFKFHKAHLVCAISVHVDDLAVVGEEALIKPLMDQLEKTYTVGQREELHQFLSLKITQDSSGKYVYLLQAHYIDDIRDQYLSDSFTTTKTPTASGFKHLGPRKPLEPVSPGPYDSLIGALLWVAQSTRADISFAVNHLSQFLPDPSTAHWHAAVRVLQYLVTTKDLKLCLGGDLELSGYADSNLKIALTENLRLRTPIGLARDRSRGSLGNNPRSRCPALRQSIRLSLTYAKRLSGWVIYSLNFIFVP